MDGCFQGEEVLFDAHQVVDQRPAAGARNPGEIFPAQLLCHRREPGNHALGARREVEQIRAAVLGVVTARDPTGPDQPLGVATHTDFSDLQELGEFRLRATRLPGEVKKKQPLRSGQPKAPDAPVEFPAHQPVDVGKKEAGTAHKIGASFEHGGKLVS